MCKTIEERVFVVKPPDELVSPWDRNRYLTCWASTELCNCIMNSCRHVCGKRDTTDDLGVCEDHRREIFGG